MGRSFSICASEEPIGRPGFTENARSLTMCQRDIVKRGQTSQVRTLATLHSSELPLLGSTRAASQSCLGSLFEHKSRQSTAHKLA